MLEVRLIVDEFPTDFSQSVFVLEKWERERRLEGYVERLNDYNYESIPLVKRWLTINGIKYDER